MKTRVFGTNLFNAAGRFAGVAADGHGGVLAVISGPRSRVLRFEKSGELDWCHEHTRQWRDIAVAPGGDYIVGWGGEVARFDSKRAKVWAIKTGGDRLAVSDDGSHFATFGRDSIARFWNAEAGELLFEVSESKGEIFCAAFSPDGRFAASVSGGDYGDGKWVPGTIDWEPLKATMRNGGPDSGRRVETAAANWADTAWVRESRALGVPA